MSNLAYETKTEEIGKYLRYMINDWCDAEKSRSAFKILQVPEEKRKYYTYTQAHKPGYEQERSITKIGERPQHSEPFWNLFGFGSKNSALQEEKRHIL